MFSLKTLLKGTFSLLTCHLQFSITARVSMTLKRQSVQSFSDHKTARTFWVSQERGIVERRVWSKWSANGRSLLSGAEGRGVGWGVLVWGTEWDWGEKRKIRLKNTIETDKEKIKERKKWQFRSLKAVEKLVLPNPFQLINNKVPKVLDAQVEYIP